MTPARQTAAAAAGLATPLQYVKGVGPQRAKLLAQEGPHDRRGRALLPAHPPRGPDPAHARCARSRSGQVVTCAGTIVGVSPPPPGRRRAPLVLLLRDASGYGTATLFGARLAHARAAARPAADRCTARAARFKDKITLQVQDWEIVESGDDEPHPRRRARARLLDHRGAAAARAADAHVAARRGARGRGPRDAAGGGARRRRLPPLAEALRGAHFPAERGERRRPRIAGSPSTTSCCCSSAWRSCARARRARAASR